MWPKTRSPGTVEDGQRWLAAEGLLSLSLSLSLSALILLHINPQPGCDGTQRCLLFSPHFLFFFFWQHWDLNPGPHTCATPSPAGPGFLDCSE
jgi:hypothetical protein